jgi:hypothetical protein
MFDVHHGIIPLAPVNSNVDIADPSSAPARALMKVRSWMHCSSMYDTDTAFENCFDDADARENSPDFT